MSSPLHPPAVPLPQRPWTDHPALEPPSPRSSIRYTLHPAASPSPTPSSVAVLSEPGETVRLHKIVGASRWLLRQQRRKRSTVWPEEGDDPGMTGEERKMTAMNEGGRRSMMGMRRKKNGRRVVESAIQTEDVDGEVKIGVSRGDGRIIDPPSSSQQSSLPPPPPTQQQQHHHTTPLLPFFHHPPISSHIPPAATTYSPTDHHPLTSYHPQPAYLPLYPMSPPALPFWTYNPFSHMMPTNVVPPIRSEDGRERARLEYEDEKERLRIGEVRGEVRRALERERGEVERLEREREVERRRREMEEVGRRRREGEAATLIQKMWRGHAARRDFIDPRLNLVARDRDPLSYFIEHLLHEVITKISSTTTAVAHRAKYHILEEVLWDMTFECAKEVWEECLETDLYRKPAPQADEEMVGEMVDDVVGEHIEGIVWDAIEEIAFDHINSSWAEVAFDLLLKGAIDDMELTSRPIFIKRSSIQPPHSETLDAVINHLLDEAILTRLLDHISSGGEGFIAWDGCERIVDEIILDRLLERIVSGRVRV
ncbi:hypothetical protein HDU67_000634 [Dinochytrium kinnereticum]|nr:hypothetical protein HDU67_000634 [Dinochytrium kinnereticum]